MLQDEGYVERYETVRDGRFPMLRVYLKYTRAQEPLIQGARRVSKPGCRIYSKKDEIPWVRYGLGTVILSTPKGVYGRVARRAARVWAEKSSARYGRLWAVVEREVVIVSRVGRMPITVPSSVRVGIDGQMVTVQGPKGTLALDVHPRMQVALDEGALRVARPDDTQQNRALHGLTRALLANMVTGVTDGFVTRLVITGVGYRAEVQGNALVLFVGYSHSVRIEAPEGVSFEVDRSGRLIGVFGTDKALVGETAARVRAVRKPEPYHGTGIAYEGEVIRRKAGKAGRSGGGR